MTGAIGALVHLSGTSACVPEHGGLQHLQTVRACTGWALWCPRRRPGAAGAAARAAPRMMREVAWAATARRRGARGARAGLCRGAGAQAETASLVAMPSCLLPDRVRGSKPAVCWPRKHHLGSQGGGQPVEGRRGSGVRMQDLPSVCAAAHPAMAAVLRVLVLAHVREGAVASDLCSCHAL